VGGTWTGSILVTYLIIIYNTCEDNSMRILTVKFSPDGKPWPYGTDDLTIEGTVNCMTLQRNNATIFRNRAGVYDVEFSLMQVAGERRFRQKTSDVGT